MKRKLASIAKNLTDEEIHELIRIRRVNDKKIVSLRRKRDKIAAQLAAVDAELAKYGDVAEPARRGRKPGPKKGAARGRRTNLSAAVRQVFAGSPKPLRASQVVDGLPKVGIKVKDIADMRKRVSVVLASQKVHFEQVERGVYQLKKDAAKKEAAKPAAKAAKPAAAKPKKRVVKKAAPKKEAPKNEAPKQ